MCPTFWVSKADTQRNHPGDTRACSMPTPTGIEALVCEEIARRQALGIAKYGQTVADNPIALRAWLQHAFEESLDLSIYLRRSIAEIDNQYQKAMKLKVKTTHPDAKLPYYSTPGAACFDLFALTVNGAFTIGSNLHEGYPVTCGTGLAFEIPAGHVMLIFSRSGHGFNFDTRLANCVGVIDSDYRGEVKVKLTCDSDQPDDKPPFFVKPGDKVAQAMIVPVPSVAFELVDELTSTERGTGGFGSTES